jgi:hypothetical protein
MQQLTKIYVYLQVNALHIVCFLENLVRIHGFAVRQIYYKIFPAAPFSWICHHLFSHNNYIYPLMNFVIILALFQAVCVPHGAKCVFLVNYQMI